MSGRRLPIALLVLDLDAFFLLPWIDPFVGGEVVAALVLGVVALNVWAWRRRPAWLDRLDGALRGSEAAQRAVLLVSSLVVAGGAVEHLARGLTSLGVIEKYSAMRTMLPEGTADWRMAHLTADRYREPDPELLWRPVAAEPYNRQRFKGPELPAGDGDDGCRIFTYGDSNTDGPQRGGWPARLGELLDGSAGGPAGRARCLVVNAGVTGYSSHQGLVRLRRDATRYRPDLVLVSFGWNDVAPALGPPDREFRTPPAAWLAVQRWLLRYRAFLVARRYWPRAEPPPSSGPRVPLDDYRANLAGFLATAAEHGGRAVLLTRPHLEPPERLAARDDWRRHVPAYNDAVRLLAAERGAPLVDVQRVFADRPGEFVDECHFTPEGHLEMARLVAAELDRQGLLPATARGTGGRNPLPPRS